MAEAIKDWERVRNSSGKSSHVCQLCGHTGYSYSYVIRHKVKKDVELLIGSNCAENFWPLMMPMLPPVQPRRLVLVARKAPPLAAAQQR
ncbi:hypothetical protein BVG81_004655 [Haliangium sp. UPWRP_2]|nr:hypothetical protein BVG81_004655 [Haliangium sp. UPWRP_2]